MIIALGSDHIAFQMKIMVAEYLQSEGYDTIDCGTYSQESCDYYVYGEKTARAVADGEADLGIVMCGTGVGISLAANKVAGIRAVVCSEPYTAKLSREHNDTNILAFGARVVGFDLAKMIISQWLSTGFEGGRHKKRIEMMEQILP